MIQPRRLRRMGRRLTATIALLALPAVLAVTASAPASASIENNCQLRNGDSTPFTRWGDPNSYFTLVGGMFEVKPSGWTLTGGSGVVAGNEPWNVVSAGTAHSLRIPAAGSATTQWFCVRPYETAVRFFTKAPGSNGSALTVTVTATFLNDAKTAYNAGTVTTTYTIDGSTAGWAVSPVLQLPQRAGGTGSMISVRIAASGGDWQIDDFEVDPWKTW
jgi:hypothetical protein